MSQSEVGQRLDKIHEALADVIETYTDAVKYQIPDDKDLQNVSIGLGYILFELTVLRQDLAGERE